jgi:hypothetical protein
MLSWLEGKLLDGLEYHFGIAVRRYIINDVSDHDRLQPVSILEYAGYRR